MTAQPLKLEPVVFLPARHQCLDGVCGGFLVHAHQSHQPLLADETGIGLAQITTQHVQITHGVLNIFGAV
ncbi:hypothetical protein D3C80_1820200 [compost metagenome]